MKINEEELQRRRKLMPPMRIAGPDDPIYKGGLVMTSLPRLKWPPAVPEPQQHPADGDDGGDADG